MYDKEEVIALILEECVIQEVNHPEQIKYILATIEHETNNTFNPVVEAYWVKDKMIKSRGKIKGKARYEDWAKRHFRYYPYYGRGLVQITWKRNYKRFSEILTALYKCEYIDLVKYPELTLNLEISIKIAVYGMKHGVFTGKKLDDYINVDKLDLTNARRIINGTDKAEHVASLSRGFTNIG